VTTRVQRGGQEAKVVVVSVGLPAEALSEPSVLAPMRQRERDIANAISGVRRASGRPVSGCTPGRAGRHGAAAQCQPVRLPQDHVNNLTCVTPRGVRVLEGDESPGGDGAVQRRPLAEGAPGVGQGMWLWGVSARHKGA